jgi:hypothetical protein
VTYEDQWNAYVARIEKEHGPIAPSDAEIKHLREGDEHLFELGQQRLRRVSKGTSLEDEQRRWIYDCAVIGDTIAGAMDADRWKREPQARAPMLLKLSDYLGVHYLGREAHRMPPLRFVKLSAAGWYSPQTRQIEINCQLRADDHPWEAAATVVHERTHDWQVQIMDGNEPSGHILGDKIDRWRTTLSAPYAQREIERGAYQTEILAMLRWALRLDKATGFSEFGLDSRQAMYGIMAALMT